MMMGFANALSDFANSANHNDFGKVFGTDADHLWQKYINCDQDLMELYRLLDLNNQRKLCNAVIFKTWL